uniref:U6-Liphistoxin-Lsp1a_1 n=2 Tax=Liphistius TaxID=62150 RepID=A0A4Q8K287_9ARAC
MNSPLWSTLSVFWICLLFLCDYGEAIKCWVCRSDADPRCKDPFDNTTLPITDCDAYSLEHYPGLKATMCRKIRQKVYGDWRFIRTCAFLGTPGEGTGNENYCSMRTGTYNVFVETCTCNSKDGCNSASLTRFSILALGLSFLILLGVVKICF